MSDLPKDIPGEMEPVEPEPVEPDEDEEQPAEPACELRSPSIPLPPPDNAQVQGDDPA